MRRFGKSFALGSLLLCAGVPAQACIVPGQQNFSHILDADAVFVGEMLEYERVPLAGGGPIHAQGQLTYRVDDVLSGALNDQVEIIWPASSLGVPAERESPGPEIVSVSRLEHGNGDGEPNSSLFLVKGPCSGPLVLNGTPKNVAIVKGWLANGVVDFSEINQESGQQEPAIGASGAVDQNVIDQRNDSDRNWLFTAMLALLSICTVAACLIAWRMVLRGD